MKEEGKNEKWKKKGRMQSERREGLFAGHPDPDCGGKQIHHQGEIFRTKDIVQSGRCYIALQYSMVN